MRTKEEILEQSGVNVKGYRINKPVMLDCMKIREGMTVEEIINVIKKW